jgi:KRAB domain-containing zinc finger protein
MKPLFGSSIDNMMTEITEILVQPADNLPAQVCVQCVLQISRSFTFKKLCQHNDQLLHNQLTLISDGQHQALELPVITEEPPADEPLEDSLSEQMNDELVEFIDDSTVTDDIKIMTMDIVQGDYFVADEADKVNMLTEEVELLFFCVNCGMNYENEEQLQAHIEACRDKQPVDPPPVVVAASLDCEFCAKRFGDIKAFKRHQKIHLGKPHVCPICKAAFTESSNLTKHKKKHSGELRNVQGKPHLCQVCGLSFKWQSSLSKHSKHHTMKKLFYCQFCPKYYVEFRSLQTHQMEHTGERPYQCQYCEKCFTQKCNRQKHERIHTKAKPFKCPVCEKSFSQSGYVQIHVRQVHSGIKSFECDECGKKFAASNTLIHHKSKK